MFKCEKCNVEFKNGKVYANHIRWKHEKHSINRLTCPLCNKECVAYAFSSHYKTCKTKLKTCKECNNEFINKWGNAIFCCRACSAKHSNRNRIRNPWSKEKREAYSKRQLAREAEKRASGNIKVALNFKTQRLQKIFHHICVVCSKSFTNFKSKTKTCSKNCKYTLNKINSTNHPNCGGETNYKRYSYKNVIMDSSWEVEVAKYLDQQNIKWVRSRKLMLYWIDSKNTKRRYFPDFYLPDYDIYVDPKNTYKQRVDKEKLEYISKYYNLIVGDINHCTSEIKKITKGGVA